MYFHINVIIGIFLCHYKFPFMISLFPLKVAFSETFEGKIMAGISSEDKK